MGQFQGKARLHLQVCVCGAVVVVGIIQDMSKSKVKAAYNYSYNYEGKKISFKKDEEFQLLTKSNKDWWQVRRWMEGTAQDIYVPAVYMKEVEEACVVVQEESTYMNLHDIKTPKSVENGTRGPGDKLPDIPIVQNKPKSSNSFKKGSLERGAGDHSKESGSTLEDAAKTTNGLNPARPVSPGMLRRLSNKGPAASSLAGPPASLLAGPAKQDNPGAGSLKRGDVVVPPPVSTKPRSKSNAVDTVGESSLDSGSTRFNRQVSGGVVVVGAKVKVPPPVQSKPKPQKVGVARPVSCIAPGTEMEGEGGGAGRPIVSELSNVLLKNLIGEHKALVKTSSSGAVMETNMGGSKADGHLDIKSPTESNKLGAAPAFSIPPPPPASPPSLPAGWTEHKTSSGQIYFYNAASGQSSWSRPQGDVGGGADSKYLEKVAPQGWTKEINPITRTPIYTNSRTGERWALGSDTKGNHYYYNMINSSITVGELPEVDAEEENVYDSLLPVGAKKPKGPSTPSTSPVHVSGRSMSTPNVIISESIAASMSDVLKRHGYLHRKRVFDPHGKKAKDRNWLKYYVTLQGYEIIFYHDLKTKDSGSKPSSVFCLLQTTVTPYNKDKKRANVFQVSSHLGEQFLLQAETSNLLNEWYSTIQAAIDQANHDFKDNPDKFRNALFEPLLEDTEGSPKLSSSLNRSKKSFRGLTSRNQSVPDEDEEEDIMDDMEISAAERSGHIRGRLRKLMARRPEKDALKTKGILEDPLVFGCDLTKLCERQGTMVPKFFSHFTQHIEKMGLDVVGIYRLSGNAASINKLRYQVDQDEQDEVDLDSQEWSDINIVTGCLKLYLRELPDPLVPFKLYRHFIEAARAPSQPQRVQLIAARVKELPRVNYCTLKALLIHLRKVVEFGSVNKMLATNVAIVFGPTVMREETDSLAMATLMPVQNGIVEIMVNEFETIFRK